MSVDFLIDLAGWIGALEVILAYLLISFNKLDSKSNIYQLLNLTGGIVLIVNTIYKQAYPSAFVNIVWVVIAAVALMRKK